MKLGSGKSTMNAPSVVPLPLVSGALSYECSAEASSERCTMLAHVESLRRYSQAAVAVAALFVLGTGCTNEQIIFRDRELFNPPPDASSGFLGYFTVADKQTTCGNCHVGMQGQWVTSRHAGAYATLAALPAGVAQDFCFGCHTVNERGNALDVAAGWSVVQDSAYRDVQCESCHGPGLTHVENPDASQPLASIAVGATLTNGCAECHQGAHHPFVEQWEVSRHSTVPVGTRATNATCQPCHEGRAAIERKFGETAPYVEKGGTAAQPIVCAVCHDPHGSPNTAQLRRSITEPTLDHLCVTCHSRSGTPPSSRGPHAAQGLLVLGENVGWIPPNFAYDTARIVGSHGTTANPKLCATCHVAMFEVTDPASGDFVFQSVGHTFEAIPCLDAQGLPTTGPCTLAERDFRACATSGCHGTQATARSIFQVVQNRINNLLDQLWTDTDNDSVIDAFPTDAGLLPKVVAQGVAAELTVTDQTVTIAEGALWNAQLAFTSSRPYWGDGSAFGVHFGAHKASGGGVHNPFLLEALLTASIQAVKDRYGVTAPEFDLSVHATPPPGLTRR